MDKVSRLHTEYFLKLLDNLRPSQLPVFELPSLERLLEMFQRPLNEAEVAELVLLTALQRLLKDALRLYSDPRALRTMISGNRLEDALAIARLQSSPTALDSIYDLLRERQIVRSDILDEIIDLLLDHKQALTLPEQALLSSRYFVTAVAASGKYHRIQSLVNKRSPDSDRSMVAWLGPVVETLHAAGLDEALQQIRAESMRPEIRVELLTHIHQYLREQGQQSDKLLTDALDIAQNMLGNGLWTHLHAYYGLISELRETGDRQEVERLINLHPRIEERTRLRNLQSQTRRRLDLESADFEARVNELLSERRAKGVSTRASFRLLSALKSAEQFLSPLLSNQQLLELRLNIQRWQEGLDKKTHDRFSDYLERNYHCPPDETTAGNLHAQALEAARSNDFPLAFRLLDEIEALLNSKQERSPGSLAIGGFARHVDSSGLVADHLYSLRLKLSTELARSSRFAEALSIIDALDNDAFMEKIAFWAMLKYQPSLNLGLYTEAARIIGITDVVWSEIYQTIRLVEREHD
jgi:hypothetical protein